MASILIFDKFERKPFLEFNGAMGLEPYKCLRYYTVAGG